MRFAAELEMGNHHITPPRDGRVVVWGTACRNRAHVALRRLVLWRCLLKHGVAWFRQRLVPRLLSKQTW